MMLCLNVFVSIIVSWLSGVVVNWMMWSGFWWLS